MAFRTFLQHSCHIEGLIAQVLVIDRPAGRENLVTHNLAIDLGFIQAKRGDIQAGRLDPRAKLELAAQVG